jgi:hypothetical protein
MLLEFLRTSSAIIPENTGLGKFFRPEKRAISLKNAHPKGEPQEMTLFAYIVGQTAVA